MLSTALLAAAFLSSLIAIAAALHKEKVVDGTTAKRVRAIRINAAATFAVFLLSAANQYVSNVQANELRIAQLRLNVLEQLSKHRINILDNYFALLARATTIHNYSSYTEALARDDNAARAVPPWEEVAGEGLRKELSEARTAFANLQQISRQLWAIENTHPDFVPPAVGDWAEVIIGMDFLAAPKLIDDRRHPVEAQKYAKLLKNALAQVSNDIAETKKVLQQ